MCLRVGLSITEYSKLGLDWNELIFLGEILDCPICHLAVEAMAKILNNPNVDHDVEHVLEKTCRAVPKHYRNKVGKHLSVLTSEIFICLFRIL